MSQHNCDNLLLQTFQFLIVNSYLLSKIVDSPKVLQLNLIDVTLSPNFIYYLYVIFLHLLSLQSA